jgi:NTP pyrophosphatase (non-canonical NTP hydrolase)
MNRDEQIVLDFVSGWDLLAERVNANAHAKGFYETPRRFGETVALIHSELSEALEGYRAGNPASEHIPQFSAIEEEYADVLIRIMDDAMEHEHNVAGAVLAKIAFNSTRPHKHGGKVI